MLFGNKERENLAVLLARKAPVAALYVFYISDAPKSCHPSVNSDPKAFSCSVSMSSRGPVELQKTIDSSSEKSHGGKYLTGISSQHYVKLYFGHTHRHTKNLRQISMRVPLRFQKCLKSQYHIPYYSLRLKQRKKALPGLI